MVAVGPIYIFERLFIGVIIGVVHRSAWASLNTDSTATAGQCEWFIRMILCSESPATFQVGIADNHCIDMTDVTGYHGK